LHSQPFPGRVQSRLKASIVLLCVVCTVLPACRRHPHIVVGSKNFTEQIILAELIAQQIENKTHLPVERRFYLGGTYIAHQAVLAGRIDIYPEYTGTALTAVLKEQASSDRKAVFDRVKSEYERRYQLTLGLPLGFNDTFAIEIRGEDARRLGLQTLSQAAAYTPRWRPGFGYEFMERPDGYRGLAATYGLRFAAQLRSDENTTNRPSGVQTGAVFTERPIMGMTTRRVSTSMSAMSLRKALWIARTASIGPVMAVPPAWTIGGSTGIVARHQVT